MAREIGTRDGLAPYRDPRGNLLAEAQLPMRPAAVPY